MKLADLFAYRDANKPDNMGLCPIPHIICKSGLVMSVQAGMGIYSSPRAACGPYEAVEVGFPSQKVEALMPYTEDSSCPTETVYAYVPIHIVDKVIADNGGIDIDAMRARTTSDWHPRLQGPD